MIVLNGQESSWLIVKAGVPQGLILHLPLLLDTRLFNTRSTVSGSSLSTALMNNAITKMSEWAYKSEMTFNPDNTKQIQEVIFSCK